MKVKLREDLEAQEKAKADGDVRKSCKKSSSSATNSRLPPHLSSVSPNNRLRSTVQQLAQMGVSPEMLDPKGMRDAVKEEAELEARVSVLLRAVAEKEGIEVSDADLQKTLSEIAAQNGVSLKRVRESLESEGQLEGYRISLRHEKTLDMILEKAKISDAPPEEEGSADDGAASEQAEGEAGVPKLRAQFDALG